MRLLVQPAVRVQLPLHPPRAVLSPMGLVRPQTRQIALLVPPPAQPVLIQPPHLPKTLLPILRVLLLPPQAAPQSKQLAPPPAQLLQHPRQIVVPHLRTRQPHPQRTAVLHPRTHQLLPQQIAVLPHNLSLPGAIRSAQAARLRSTSRRASPALTSPNT